MKPLRFLKWCFGVCSIFRKCFGGWLCRFCFVL
ncbi:hypothetical protein DDP49_01505 [Helicobacter pylori]|nr:hypothetical protein DDP49_01505 [Helicobacter pylori]